MTVLTAEPSPGEAPECAGLHAAYAEFVKHPQVERTIEASTALLGRQRELAGRCAEMRRVEFVGPQVGSELAYDGRAGAVLCVHFHHAVPGGALRVEILGSGDRRQFPRRGAGGRDVSRSSAGSSRCPCWRPCWRCSATRSTNR